MFSGVKAQKIPESDWDIHGQRVTLNQHAANSFYSYLMADLSDFKIWAIPMTEEKKSQMSGALVLFADAVMSGDIKMRDAVEVDATAQDKPIPPEAPISVTDDLYRYFRENPRYSTTMSELYDIYLAAIRFVGRHELPTPHSPFFGNKTCLPMSLCSMVSPGTD